MRKNQTSDDIVRYLFETYHLDQLTEETTLAILRLMYMHSMMQANNAAWIIYAKFLYYCIPRTYLSSDRLVHYLLTQNFNPMKKYFILILMAPALLWSQSDDQPTLWEVVNIKVKSGMEDQFEDAVKAHNEKFHGEGAHQAQLQMNINGPYAGYQWIMGPTNWAAMDTRPDGDDHNNDWAKVTEMVESMEPPQYWNTDVENSQLLLDPANNKSIVWMYDLHPGKGSQWSELIGKVKEVYQAKRSDEDFFVGWNQFSNAKGEDAVIIFTMDKWGELDQQRNFGDEYEEVHGKGTWHAFLNHINECVKQRVDWMRMIVD